jgi:outer membrane lipopolysaccharide assembly protein LptE/RlpB
MRHFKLFSLLLCCLMLSACGFALRKPQAVTLAPSLQTMYLATSNQNDPFVQQLERILTANGITLVADPKVATSTLNLLSVQSTNTMINSGGVNVSGFYTAYLTVSFNVVDNKGNTLIPTTSLQQSQNFSSSASQVLSGSAIAAQLTIGMQQALAQNIITQLTHVPMN